MRQLFQCGFTPSLDKVGHFMYIKHGDHTIEFGYNGENLGVVCQVMKGKCILENVIHIDAGEMLLDCGKRPETVSVIECKSHGQNDIRTMLYGDIDGQGV
jgi:hypothetical protein